MPVNLLDALPPELVVTILARMDPTTRIRASQTCHFIHAMVWGCSPSNDPYAHILGTNRALAGVLPPPCADLPFDPTRVLPVAAGFRQASSRTSQQDLAIMIITTNRHAAQVVRYCCIAEPSVCLPIFCGHVDTLDALQQLAPHCRGHPDAHIPFARSAVRRCLAVEGARGHDTFLSLMACAGIPDPLAFSVVPYGWATDPAFLTRVRVHCDDEVDPWLLQRAIEASLASDDGAGFALVAVLPRYDEGALCALLVAPYTEAGGRLLARAGLHSLLQGMDPVRVHGFLRHLAFDPDADLASVAHVRDILPTVRNHDLDLRLTLAHLLATTRLWAAHTHIIVPPAWAIDAARIAVEKNGVVALVAFAKHLSHKDLDALATHAIAERKQACLRALWPFSSPATRDLAREAGLLRE
jgi:hypothetical protein